MSAPPVPRTTRTITSGRHYPLGATPGDGGVNFALGSARATAVWLELFASVDGEATDVIPLTQRTRNVWHAFVQGVGAGQLYGYRVAGEFDPGRGLRFNEHKLVLDPYAKALSHKPVDRDNLLLAYDPGSPARDLSRDERDNAAVVPRSVVVDDAFDWQGDAPPGVPLEQLIVYEVHLKGFTRHPSSGVAHPGTYLGFIEKIPYLQELGVNAVELLPVHEHHVEDFLLQRGLTNYWGYNTLAFFAPESSFAAGSQPGCQVAEFKQLVRALHRAGLEVILDVVYNHTAEGNELGPSFHLKAIDNPSYYSLIGPPDEPGRYYQNHTGCGNSLDLSQPQAIRLVMDSLRYWVEAMHVDGFRFDLASVLGRGGTHGFERTSAFFDVVSQDPLLQRVKLIAEPWDLGTYQVGNFPVDWSEWNGRFRDTVRRFAQGCGGMVPDLGWRLTGSADLYADDGRSAYNSVNFVTCHDGFTLWDLVSYDGKQNEANGEGNRDGTDDNHSWGCGVHGPTADPGILELRQRQAKNLAVILLSALGTPMILGGDEMLHSQRGNNNAYCQDNELSWLDWGDLQRHGEMVEFVRRAIAFNKRHTILHRRKFLTGADANGNLVPDLRWLGCSLDAPAWMNPELRTICYMLDGSEEPSPLGTYFLFFALNADSRQQYVLLPPLADGQRWCRIADTSLPAGADFARPGEELPLDPADHYLVNSRSVVVLIGR